MLLLTDTARYILDKRGIVYMKIFEIEDVREFMEHLFLKEMFDKFCLGSMEVKTLVSISVKGNLYADWLEGSERELYGELEFVPWKLFRPLAFSMIRGKQKPRMLRIYFVCYMENGDCGGLRIQYENDRLTCMSTYTPAEFSMDKGREQQWDENCEIFFRKNGIVSTHLD